jgi:glycosyltransferase involved in cell wall biosynthesis
MEVDYICGHRTDRLFGMAKYEQEINRRITDVQFNRIDYLPLRTVLENRYPQLFSSQETSPEKYQGPAPSPPHPLVEKMVNLARSSGRHLDSYRYQLMVKRAIRKGNIKHLTLQELGFLLNAIPTRKTVINCHDLIPWVYDQERSRWWKNNMRGLVKARKMITVSQFSRDEIVKHLHYPEEDVHVIYDAVDHQRYHPQVEKPTLEEGYKYLLYVGSETPRMNLDLLLQALAKLKNLIPQVRLLKIGEAQVYGAREELLRRVNELNLNQEVLFLGYLPEEELPGWYAAADVVVYPCLYAGFGLPPLEAMACGTPVVTSNTTSLPEVVGDAGLMFNPHRVDELVTKLYEVLSYQNLQRKLIKRGLKRSQLFTWEQAAALTRQVYQELDELK